MLAHNENGIAVNDFKDRINGTKRFCTILTGIFENEKIIKTQGSGVDTRIFITQAGKNFKFEESLKTLHFSKIKNTLY